MTDEVAALVLADNENQGRCLTLDGIRSAARYEEFVALVEDMVGAGLVNRADDQIPTREELLASQQRERGLPRPLLSVLLGNAKMWAQEMIMETDFPDSDTAKPLLDSYFPKRLRESFAPYFPEHYLRREIVACVAINHLVNNAGIAFLSRTMTKTQAGIGEVVKAYLDRDRSTGAFEERQALLAQGIDASSEHQALLALEEKLEAATVAALSGESAAKASRAEAGRRG
jgi:glutamate dehydrogenase